MLQEDENEGEWLQFNKLTSAKFFNAKTSLQVVCKREKHEALIYEIHAFAKVKERYW